MSNYVYKDGTLVESWDDTSRTYTDYRLPLVPGENPRDYNEQENAEADARAEQEQKAANEQALRDGLQDAIDAALARQAEYQTIIDTPNSEIKANPQGFIVKAARQGKRAERALIRLCRLVGNLTTTADTGTD